MTKEILFKAVENLIAAHPGDTIIKRLGANFKVDMLFAGKTKEAVIERIKPFEKIVGLSTEETATVKELLLLEHFSQTEARTKGKTLVTVTKVDNKKVYFGEMLQGKDAKHVARMREEARDNMGTVVIIPRVQIAQESMTYNNGHNAVAGKTYLVDTIETASRGIQFDPNAGNKMHEIAGAEPELSLVEKIQSGLSIARVVSGDLAATVKNVIEPFKDIFGKAAEDVKEKSKKRAKHGAGDAESLDF